ncbi:hypothetical protein LSCM1_07031 [Leishmania martiniquensis]|uniref:Exonuclease domain-containing protein n=1 Tax=Leishmania martiniquensis TaxID=1580590 RepID=A0A836KW20_9TRYP|nr:hypothetical protein LSCM1_07031 [Leishmania martiniquensis]
MPSSYASGAPSDAPDNEGAHAARCTRSPSSRSSSASGSQRRSHSLPSASTRSGSPVIVGATSSARTEGTKRSRRKKARQETDAVRAATTSNAQSPQPRDPHLLGHAAAAPSLLGQAFSEVELQFQLEQDRAQRSTLTPRDIANLILWSVPTPVPIIESPRIFFIKNKSRVRNTVVVYVNGWSYDEMLCTGVGLPRARGEAHCGSVPRGEGTVSHLTAGEASTTAHAAESTTAVTNARGADQGDPAAHWVKELCGAMLSPVREGRCWARSGRGAGCTGGVQYCPLFIPSTRNELEKDLWWRNDAPRRPGTSSAATSASPDHCRPRGRRIGGVGEAMDADRTNPAVEDARGVGSMFQQAMQVHAKGSGSGDGAASAESSPTAASPRAPASPTLSSATFQQHAHLWKNTTLLRQYALHLPEHTAQLQELGFTLAPPEELTDAAAAEGRDAGADEEATAPQNHGREEGAEEAVWLSFAAPATAEATSGIASATVAAKVVAFDCEMVQVEGGESALARATVLDVLTGGVALDMLVKPRQRVTDYRTRFSGIDAATLDSVSNTLAECQHALRRIIDTETFVVGHSLENDFKACKFIPNCYVLDTTWLFPHPAGLPYKNALRFLAQRYLQRRIQQGSHDSAIDALVSAELTQLKLINGPSFGLRPRVSVLGLIAEAAGSGVDNVSGGNGLKRRAGAGPTIQLHLFDDAVSLSSLLPAPQRSSAASTTHGAASGDTESSAPPASSANSGRIDAVPVRHDEDGMRKAVRALRRRASQLACEAAAAVNGANESGMETETQSFALFWVQLTQTRVCVVQPPTPPPAVEAEAKSANAGSPARAGDPGSCDTSSAYTSEPFRTVHDTNRRVLRIIEACPDETLIVVLTGRCDGEAGGNHFSRAQGTCFAFVKDGSAPGPRAEELAKVTDENSASALLRALAAPNAPHDTPLQCPSAPATAAAPHDVESKTAMDSTLPACQQQ